MPPLGIDPAVFPCLEADLDRVRDSLGPVRIQCRPELDALTQEGPGTSRGLVRPTLALLSYYVLTDPSVPADDRAVRAAAAVEMLHLGALYHDDVVDHAHERRGRPSANAVWGEHLARAGEREAGLMPSLRAASSPFMPAPGMGVGLYGAPIIESNA